MSDSEPELRTALERLARLDRRVGEMGGIVYEGPAWLQPNSTEPQVLYALRDLIRPGFSCPDHNGQASHGHVLDA